MGFIASYKHLDKLCKEIMDDERGISAYIDEMLNTTKAHRTVKGWEEDLRTLKRYRWIRNKIVHEVDCDEENMCALEDIEWLESFYNRIMKQQDPLTIYRKLKESNIRRNESSDVSVGSGNEKVKSSNEALNNLLYIILGTLSFLIVSGLIVSGISYYMYNYFMN